MIFSQTTFIFFVAAILLVFSFIPQHWRLRWLILASLIWYASWEWSWSLVLLSILAFNYLALRFIPARRYDLLIALNALIFILLKSGGVGRFSFDSPYGSSFYLFIIVAVVFDRWRAQTDGPISWEKFFLLPSFFPLLVGGPIERSAHFWDQLNDLKFRYHQLVDGLLIFSWGFLKLHILSAPLVLINKAFYYEIYNRPYYLLLFGFTGTLQAYIDFSSYTEMGRGVARLFGVKLAVQFRPFYFARNPNDYWQRWNITLGTWIRDYVSFPLMLRFGRQYGQHLIILFSFLLVGLWHGLSWNWLFFGLFNGLMIISFNWVHKKTALRGVGLFFAFLVIVGNGILQRDFGLMEFRAFAPEIIELEWLKFREASGVIFYGMLFTLLVMELIQEKKRLLDWYLQWPLLFKSLLALALMLLFLWALDADLLTEKVIPLPSYFKI